MEYGHPSRMIFKVSAHLYNCTAAHTAHSVVLQLQIITTLAYIAYVHHLRLSYTL
jgi:hypothetical protein